jgi:hypothetical protein
MACELHAWIRRRNHHKAGIDWRFTLDDSHQAQATLLLNRRLTKNQVSSYLF